MEDAKAITKQIKNRFGINLFNYFSNEDTTAMAKKGLSLEEKRTKAMEYFHETKGVYLMKELEKLLPKFKGITAMTVKDVVQSLVDDNMVMMEKIGTSNYFWSFPSHAQKLRENQLNQLQQDKKMLLKSIQNQNTVIEDLLSDRQDPSRIERIHEYKQISSEIDAIQEKLNLYKDFDPQVLKFKSNAVLVAKEAVNRWTDNVFIVQGFLAKEFSVPSNDFNQMYAIDDKFDNVE